MRYLRIDNPGGGNCGFYSIANGLILQIQQEALSEKTVTLDLWWKLLPQISKNKLALSTQTDFQNIILAFQYDKKKIDYQHLKVLSMSLRHILFRYILDKIQEDFIQSPSANLAYYLGEREPTADEIKEVEAGRKTVLYKHKDAYHVGFALGKPLIYKSISIVKEENSPSRVVQEIIEELDELGQQNLLEPVRMIRTTNLTSFLENIDKAISLPLQSFSKLYDNTYYQYFSKAYADVTKQLKLLSKHEYHVFSSDPKILEKMWAIKSRYQELKERAAQQPKEYLRIESEETEACMHLFTEFLLPDLNSEPPHSTPISKVMEQLLNYTYWASESEITELVHSVFNLNFHYYKKRTTSEKKTYLPAIKASGRDYLQAAPNFNDTPGVGAIGIANEGNAHWVTIVPQEYIIPKNEFNLESLSSTPSSVTLTEDLLEPPKDEDVISKRMIAGRARDIERLLATLAKNVIAIDEFRCSDATHVAILLVDNLFFYYREYQDTLRTRDVNILKAKKTFKQHCTQSIVSVMPLIKRDLDWGDYLSNLFKTFLNVLIKIITFGQKKTFFTHAESESKEVFDEFDSRLDKILKQE